MKKYPILKGNTLNYFHYMGQSTQKSGLSKFCGRQPLKNLKGYGLLNSLLNPSSWIIDPVRFIAHDLQFQNSETKQRLVKTKTGAVYNWGFYRDFLHNWKQCWTVNKIFRYPIKECNVCKTKS